VTDWPLTKSGTGNRDTTGVDREADFPFSKERWHRKVHDAVEDAAARHLQTKAAERQLPGPETVTKRNGLLKLLPRLYVREGGELAEYGVVFRQCALSGRFQPWDNRHEQPCPHCHSPYKQVRRPLPLARVGGGSPGVRGCEERGPRPRRGFGGARRFSQAAVQPAGGRVYSGASPPLRLSDGGKSALGPGSCWDDGGRVVHPRLPCTCEESFQASQARPRLVYVLTTVQLFTHTCVFCVSAYS
jgi:hypothetical protein